MNYRKTFSRIILIASSTIAVMIVMCLITPYIVQAKILFKARIDYAAVDAPNSEAIRDLNRDGDLDPAVANGVSDKVSILINSGPATIIDLLYTPVTPCRLVDTRKAGDAISAGGIRSYNVR